MRGSKSLDVPPSEGRGWCGYWVGWVHTMASRPRSSLVVPPVTRVARSAWRPQGITDGERVIPEETAVAFAYNGCFHAVMMATPQDLEDFALGFSLTERIICAQEEIGRLEIIEGDGGIEL